MEKFELVSPYQPTGDQPQAIEKLTEGVEDGIRTQVLVGVTGSGKTFTMANVIKNVNRPTLVIAHNKTLAAQLCNEFREFFPHNRVEYFVSYYDYYQPESYIPSTDTYIEKDMSMNDEIDKLRNSATASLGERSDVLVVASVSCIYGLGAPEEYFDLAISIRPGDTLSRDDLIRRLIELQYERKDMDFTRSSFRVRGDIVEIFPAGNSEIAIRVEFFGDEVDRLSEEEVVTGKITAELKHACIFPASHYAVGSQKMQAALDRIREIKKYDVPRLRALDAHGLRFALEARNMVLSAEVMLTAALHRKESRGSHLRLDYPEIDNENWLKWILVEQKDNELCLSTKDIPIDRYPLRPEHKRELHASIAAARKLGENI